MKRLAVLIALAAALLAPALTAPAAHASAGTLGDRVLNMAETQRGCWYHYGHAGPCGQGYDCSGLIFASAARLGISIPRTTYGMLAGSAHLYRIPLSQIRRGDVLLFGTGHAELATVWYHVSFGAHHTGTRIGWRAWSSSYHPTAALRFR